jgi:endonuclease/exonuclease/phosphatase family metal-dependent hydrolase
VLPWLGSKWRGIASAGGAAFAAALKAQACDWKALKNAYPDHDVIIAGDFNQDLADTHYYGSRANRKRLVDALEQAGLVALTASNNDPVRTQSPPLACVDHICMSAGSRWRATAAHRWPDYQKPDRRLSDHFGIAVCLEALI